MNLAKPPLMNIAKTPRAPFLIVIGYWDGDRDMCREMVELMVDLQSRHAGRGCKVWLVCRQDCGKVDPHILRSLQSRFDAEGMVSTSPLTGYPGGSNGVFGTTAIHVANRSERFDGWFWMEPDCVPMQPNWWVDLQNEWMARSSGIHLIGWKGDCNGNGTGWHINGCAIYDQQFARIVPCVTQCDGIPWDYHCRGKMLEVGKETNLIHLCWRAGDATPDILKKGWMIAHGYKDGSLRKLVRKKHLK